MATKAELEERVARLEGLLEGFYDEIGDALGIEDQDEIDED